MSRVLLDPETDARLKAARRRRAAERSRKRGEARALWPFKTPQPESGDRTIGRL